MVWKPELEDLARRREMAKQMGGADKVKRQREGGRLTVRERIELMVDQGSLLEVGSIAGKAEYDAQGKLVQLMPSNFVFGRGKVNGRPVIVAGDDFTVRGGSADATIKEKQVLAELMAQELRQPIIRIIEGSGGGGSVKTIETTGRANLPGGLTPSTWQFRYTTENLGHVPVVALGLGSVAGLGAARLTASHYSVMTKGTSAVFVAGPPVVARTGESLDKQELGGWKIQTKAGAVDEAVDTEEQAFEKARRFLSYLPSSVDELPPLAEPRDAPAGRADTLATMIPKDTRKVYKMRPIIEALVDEGSFFEMSSEFGRSIITGLARIDGKAVALMASDPYHYGGAWTSDTCTKVIRFVDLAQTFHLPVIYLVDCPGFRIGLEAERAATIRYGVRAMAAVNQATVPWCSIIVRNCFGVAGAVHQPAGRFAFRYAWVTARWGSLPLEGGIEAAYRAEIDAADDPQAKLGEIEDRLNRLRSPTRTAESFWVEEIIDPKDTRKLLCEYANQAQAMLRPGPTALTMRP